MKATETAHLCALQAKKISEHVEDLYRLHVHEFRGTIIGPRPMYDRDAEAGTGKSLDAITEDITSLRRDLLALRKKLDALR